MIILISVTVEAQRRAFIRSKEICLQQESIVRTKSISVKTSEVLEQTDITYF